MREIIALEAIPWLRLMERERYGRVRSHYSHWGATRSGLGSRDFEGQRFEPRFEPPAATRRARFRFSF